MFDQYFEYYAIILIYGALFCGHAVVVALTLFVAHQNYI